MFKIAYCAGHYMETPGKRLPRELDKNQTREWTINDRVADHFAKAAAQYEGVQLLRTDDPTGKTFIDIPERVAKANAWGADLYIDMHHNAAGRVFSGGGMEAFCYPGSSEGKKYRDAIYNAVIAAGGIKGNRANPLQEKKFDSLSLTHMPAVLLEYGYMDSSVDAPIILTDAYSKKVAYATMDGVAQVAKLTKKQQVITDTVTVPRLAKGAEGDQVKAMQLLLLGYGYEMGSYGADGSFGAATQTALQAFQKAKGLAPDGICGKATWNKLLGME